MECRLKSSLCGMPLREGTMIVGALSIIFSMLESIPIILAPTTNHRGSELEDDHSRLYTSIMLIILEVALSILLIVGAIKNNYKLICPWIVYEVGLTVIAISIFLVIVVMFIITGPVFLGFVVIIIGGGLCILWLRIYMIVVASSFFLSLRDEPQMTSPPVEHPTMMPLTKLSA